MPSSTRRNSVSIGPFVFGVPSERPVRQLLGSDRGVEHRGHYVKSRALLSPVDGRAPLLRCRPSPGSSSTPCPDRPAPRRSRPATRSVVESFNAWASSAAISEISWLCGVGDVGGCHSLTENAPAALAATAAAPAREGTLQPPSSSCGVGGSCGRRQPLAGPPMARRPASTHVPGRGSNSPHAHLVPKLHATHAHVKIRRRTLVGAAPS